MGGFTAVPCALATVLAGLAGGVVFLIFKKRVAPVWAAMLLAVFTESAHMAITLAMARPFAQALDLVCEVIIPMILVNAVGMGVFVFIIHNEERERVVVAQKERMEGELAVARNIQLGIVPAVFPPFPERREFDLHASLESAREVGGDLYDFQFVDDDRLYVAIGDVAGKGVPASLFMAITLTLLRTESRRTTAPDEVLARVNAALCRNNESAMFVTLFFGFYDVHSGELRYSSGGHPAPFVVRAGSSRVEPLRRTTGAGLGISEGVVFGAASETLAPGDVLVVYSDGVTEALDGTGEMFGEERLQAELGAAGAVAAAHATASLRAAIERFASGAEQYDDITLLALRRALDGG
jgi:sigma-B regulation protein RsbU (phosphoserine phosphatase)